MAGLIYEDWALCQLVINHGSDLAGVQKVPPGAGHIGAAQQNESNAHGSSPSEWARLSAWANNRQPYFRASPCVQVAAYWRLHSSLRNLHN
jgi:hypothetical protein